MSTYWHQSRDAVVVQVSVTALNHDASHFGTQLVKLSRSSRGEKRTLKGIFIRENIETMSVSVGGTHCVTHRGAVRPRMAHRDLGS